jgi:transposase
MPKRTSNRSRVVIGGVDTHGRTHHAAVIDQQGRLLGDREFPADRGGYRLCWAGWASTGSWRRSGWKAAAATVLA